MTTTLRDLQSAAANLWDDRDAITAAGDALADAHRQHSESASRWSQLRHNAPEEVRVAFNEQRRNGDPIA